MKEEITQTSKDLVQKIRDYSTSQKELWQQIPYLAVVDEDFEEAYKYGYWSIRKNSFRILTHPMYVDLETGEFLESYRFERKTARDEAVLQLALRLGEIDAQNIINHLKKLEEYLIQENSIRHNWLREGLKLEKTYRRKNDKL